MIGYSIVSTDFYLSELRLRVISHSLSYIHLWVLFYSLEHITRHNNLLDGIGTTDLRFAHRTNEVTKQVLYTCYEKTYSFSTSNCLNFHFEFINSCTVDKSGRYLATGDTARTNSPSRTHKRIEPARIVIWDLVNYTVCASIVIPLYTADGERI